MTVCFLSGYRAIARCNWAHLAEGHSHVVKLLHRLPRPTVRFMWSPADFIGERLDIVGGAYRQCYLHKGVSSCDCKELHLYWLLRLDLRYCGAEKCMVHPHVVMVCVLAAVVVIAVEVAVIAAAVSVITAAVSVITAVAAVVIVAAVAVTVVAVMDGPAVVPITVVALLSRTQAAKIRVEPCSDIT